jgi:CspA family cold shock protein
MMPARTAGCVPRNSTAEWSRPPQRCLLSRPSVELVDKSKTTDFWAWLGQLNSGLSLTCLLRSAYSALGFLKVDRTAFRPHPPGATGLPGFTGTGPEMFGRRTVAGFVSPASPEILTVTSSEDTAMPTGTIARLLIDKGFGFIRDESGVEHFFHRSAVRGAVFELLREGQRVEFVPEESAKGPRAGDIRLIEN